MTLYSSSASGRLEFLERSPDKFPHRHIYLSRHHETGGGPPLAICHSWRHFLIGSASMLIDGFLQVTDYFLVGGDQVFLDLRFRFPQNSFLLATWLWPSLFYFRSRTACLHMCASHSSSSGGGGGRRPYRPSLGSRYHILVCHRGGCFLNCLHGSLHVEVVQGQLLA